MQLSDEFRARFADVAPGVHVLFFQYSSRDKIVCDALVRILRTAGPRPDSLTMTSITPFDVSLCAAGQVAVHLHHEFVSSIRLHQVHCCRNRSKVPLC